MPKKKKRAGGKPSKSKPQPPPKLAVGDGVRVKPGTTDPDFPDIPLGGWAGTVREVDRRSAPPTYLIEWDRHTLGQMHPVYRKRCERDGLELKSMWLGEGDIDNESTRDAPGTYDARYTPYAVDGNVVVATGTSVYRDHPDGPVTRTFDNCFLMRFDDSGRCMEFTEYFLERRG